MLSYAFFYNGQRIIPAPTFSIEKNFTYINDAIVGYTYVINIKGYASSIDPISNPNSSISNLDNTIRSLDRVHNVFHKNGGMLSIQCNGATIMEGIGGQLRSYEVSDTENRWLNYAEYNCSIEFSNVLFYDTIGTLNYEINADSSTGYPLAGSIDLSDYIVRIKDYKDSWSFSTSDEEAHAYYAISNSGTDGNSVTFAEDYTSINVEYKIDATGKHFFEPNGTLIPAWDRAKQFVQEKMYHQIAIFRRDVGAVIFDNNNTVINNNNNRTAFPLADSSRNNNVIPYDSTSIPLVPEDLLANSHTNHTYSAQGPVNPPLFGFFITQNYGIFNEKIICETSESDGSFSATYSCILKRSNPAVGFMRNATHKYDISYEETNDFTSSVRTININGTVQGLLPTNILVGAGLNDGGRFYLSLPSTGPFIVSSLDPVSKYYYAWYHFVTDIVKNPVANPKIANNHAFTDINDTIKQALAINYQTLFPYTSSNVPCLEDKNGQGGNLQLFQLLAEPRTFSISHDYNAGTVSYSASYDTERSCSKDRGFEELTVTEEDSVPIIAEFVVPGREVGPIIQNLNTYTNKKVTFAFNGVTRKGCVDGNPWQYQWNATSGDIFAFVNNHMPYPSAVKKIIETTEKSAEDKDRKLIKTADSFNYNPVDGSYSINVTYLVCPIISSGCEEYNGA